MTQLSYFLIERVLHNSVNVMIRQRDEIGVREYPLYSHDEVDDIASLFQAFKYNVQVEWSGFDRPHGKSSPTVEFIDAGHALGSAGMMVRGKNQTLFYTGDVCFHDQTILKAAEFQDVRADVLIMETTRGARSEPAGFTRAAEAKRFGKAVQEALERKANVLIPAFALGRTQEILAQLALMMKAGQIQRQQVYIGGLGRVFTEIYDLEAHLAHRQHPHLRLTEALNLCVLEKGQSQRMKLTGARLFVVTAGMMTEHTPAHDLAVRMIEDERQSIFFVGYADPDAPGGRLKAAKHGETFVFSASAGEITRRCDLRDFNLTAHADRSQMLEFVGRVSPRLVLLGHGDQEARAWFEAQILQRYPKIKVVQPGPGISVEG